MTTAPQRPDSWPHPASGHLAGPWDQGFYFVVRGRVSSKSNYRHGSGATWATLKAFAEHVRLAARAARPRGWDTGSVAQSVSQRPTIVAAVYARSMLDSGNLDKSILDAVEGTPRKGNTPATPGVVMVNDAQVAGTVAWSTRTGDDEGALIAFARLPADAPQGDVAAALAHLTLTCSNLISEEERARKQSQLEER